ncbi:MAG: exopolyphosphatase [Desulfobacterales bacterium]|nr:exopolyphosphatase [Desulfobacterales bacterium]
MRIVTRPDFDGVVCAMLLRRAEGRDRPLVWAEPGDMQRGLVDVHPGDIVANLPYNANCGLWFDHHFSNTPERPVEGLFEMAPSAAGLVYRYYRHRLGRNYDDLVHQTDRIDSADLTEDEVRHPENYPYVLLSMTISGRELPDESYWNRLVDLLGDHDIDQVMADAEVQARAEQVVAENQAYRDHLERHTQIQGQVAVTDFRELPQTPRGNRFLVYSLYPRTVVQAKIRYNDRDRERVIVSVGHSIFNRNCRVNVGLLLSDYGGGGHRGAGSCSFPREKADTYIPAILKVLVRNAPNDKPE